MIFDSQVKKLDKDNVHLKHSEARIEINLLDNSTKIDTSDIFLEDFLSDFPFGLKLNAYGNNSLQQTGFLIGKAVRLLSRKRGVGKKKETIHSSGNSVASISIDMNSNYPMEMQVLGGSKHVKELDLFFSSFTEGLQGEVKLYAQGRDLDLKVFSEVFNKTLKELLDNNK